MRVIDADALKAKFTEELQPGYPAIVIRAIIDTVPTVDIGTAKQGYWIKHSKSFRQYFCSECGGVEGCGRPYCPRCGTKMDGVKYDS